MLKLINHFAADTDNENINVKFWSTKYCGTYYNKIDQEKYIFYENLNFLQK